MTLGLHHQSVIVMDNHRTKECIPVISCSSQRDHNMTQAEGQTLRFYQEKTISERLRDLVDATQTQVDGVVMTIKGFPVHCSEQSTFYHELCTSTGDPPEATAYD